MKQFTEKDVDRWCVENDEIDCYQLLLEHIPDASRKFDKVCKAIKEYLKYIRKTFPDAQYYTAGGGFNLLLGASHTNDYGEPPQHQRSALGSIGVEIGDGDW
jgi:hypothetical protein